MAGGATTLRGGTLTLPEGSVLLLQDCEDVKLQGWTISGMCTLLVVPCSVCFCQFSATEQALYTLRCILLSSHTP